MHYVEIRPGVRRTGAPRLVPLSEVNKHTGFRTIVCYSEEVAAVIREQGGTHGLKNLPVMADTLFVDFDSHDPVDFRAWLKQSGLAYEEWDSGGRSVHFHIPMEPIEGTWVTQAMKAWLKERAPTADLSFFHNAGVYRLPGTFHAKYPGRCKALVYRQAGEPLRIAKPSNLPAFEFELHDGEKDIEDFFCLLTQAKGEGHRAPHLFLLGITAAEAGLTFDEALDHMRWWNSRFSFPVRDDLTVIRQCESAFRRAARKQA